MSDAFDPNAPEGDVGRGSQYLSKRDIRTIAIILIVGLIALYPIYKMMERNSEKARCLQNMHGIQAAMNLYAEQYDGRYPSIFNQYSNGAPALTEQGVPFTWASAVSEYMKPRESFFCPSATGDEAAVVVSMRNNAPAQDAKPVGRGLEPITYGFYAAYSTFPAAQVENPNQTLIIAETSNLGAKKSFDPCLYTKPDGSSLPYDAFVIGWNDSNLAPSTSTTSVTRLAFYDVPNGNFTGETAGRHNGGIQALTAAGSLIPNLSATSAQVGMRAGVIGGLWAVPASVTFRRDTSKPKP